MRIFLIIFVISIFTSCKEPLPVYFDKPPGQLTDTFPSSMQGNYYFVENLIKDGKAAFEKKYKILNGKIVLTENDARKKAIDSVINYNASKIDTSKTSEHIDSTDKKTGLPKQVNAFSKYAHLNSLSIIHVVGAMDSIDKKKKMAFGFVKIGKKSISIVSSDSLANNYETELYHLSDKVQLSYYSDNYYLNAKTPFGWEIMQIEIWNKGQFLNFNPFISYMYDDNAINEKEFIKSTAATYPKLKPIYNSDHLIIGMKAKLNPEILKEKFKEFDSGVELLKTEQ